MAIITGKTSAEEVKGIVQTDSKIVAAVAYWNGPAAKWFADSVPEHARHKVRIALDVKGGGTSADALKTLMKTFPDGVRVHRDLHTKIYATKKKALLGSQNASSYGLQFEEKHYDRVEAGVLLEGNEATVAYNFAKRVYEDSDPATEEHVAICKARFGRHPAAAAMSGKMDILTALFEQPEIFGDMPVILSMRRRGDEDDTEAQKKAMDEVRAAGLAKGEPRDYESPEEYHDAWDVFEISRHQFPDRNTYHDRPVLSLHVDISRPQRGVGGTLCLGIIQPLIPSKLAKLSDEETEEIEVLHAKHIRDRAAWPLLDEPLAGKPDHSYPCYDMLLPKTLKRLNDGEERASRIVRYVKEHCDDHKRVWTMPELLEAIG
ncbi:MAG: hypothetical protein ACU0DJ_08385 [Paracoccus sp. (in: a-proteobacteria)]|uniref:hypothetical protein n=1 Tax=Salipiger abyssi TaxID=1250539 RepID=UPI004058208E